MLFRNILASLSLQMFWEILEVLSKKKETNEIDYSKHTIIGLEYFLISLQLFFFQVLLFRILLGALR